MLVRRTLLLHLSYLGTQIRVCVLCGKACGKGIGVGQTTVEGVKGEKAKVPRSGVVRMCSLVNGTAPRSFGCVGGEEEHFRVSCHSPAIGAIPPWRTIFDTPSVSASGIFHVGRAAASASSGATRRIDWDGGLVLKRRRLVLGLCVERA